MLAQTSNRSTRCHRTRGLLTAAVAVLLLTPTAIAQGSPKANYKLAQRYSTEFLRKFTYDTSVTPRWIGESELFWYRFRTSEGARYWLVDPIAKTKVALFDHDVVAAGVSQATETPVDAERLDLRNLKLDDTGNQMTFEVDNIEFVYYRDKQQLESKGKKKETERSSTPSPDARGRTTRGSTQRRGEETEEQKKKAREQRKKRLLDSWKQKLEDRSKTDEDKKKEREERERQMRSRGGRSRFQPGTRPGSSSAFSPDLDYYVFAKKGNLYVVKRNGELPPIETAEKEKPAAEGAEKKINGSSSNESGKANGKAVEASANGNTDGKAKNGDDEEDEKIVFPFDVKAAIQLSTDGVEDYSYGGSLEDEEAFPVNVNWRKDSAAFYVQRSDSRGVAELFLVDSIAKPRPALQQYKYAMPGEEHIRTSDFMVFDRQSKKLAQVEPRWVDEAYIDMHWLKSGELRVVRRDRLRRNVEYGKVDPTTGEFELLFKDGAKKGLFVTQSIRYLEDRDEFIWFSERSGWGHFYLYGMDGKLKNAITKGRFRASRIVDVDEENGVLWFRGNGREKGENVYYEHLYRVRLDGGGLKLLDEGDATHRSVLSKSRKFLVDNCSRVDKIPTSVLRDGEGVEIMTLEEADMSKLEEFGWRPPERFTVKAADGTTDLYGNMWMPFDFDENKKYPIIAHVYPGPQQEGVTHTFSATGSRQELAQLGFIVIQVGHRGGTPTRSKAYGAYGYFNMRDYGLEDKKTAIEQLAARHSFIDIDRVGIYGHSGGGFMTAAALLKPPYNKFFKVGVSTAGNHDNNIYNNSWAERYHGLKEVEEQKKTKKTDDKKDGEKTDKEDGEKTEQRQRGERQRGSGRRNRGDGSRRIINTKKAQEERIKQQGQGDKKEQGQGDKKEQGQGDKKEQGQGDKKEQGQGDKKSDEKTDDKKSKTKFDIEIATNAELAGNLEGKLLLIHGEIDNNVHPAGTMRLVDALIRANKRFDMLIIPGARHSFGHASGYAKHRTWDYFVEHLLYERHAGADIREKDGYQR